MKSATDVAKILSKIDWHKEWIEKATAIIEARDNEWLAIVGEASITREPTLRQRYAMAALTGMLAYKNRTSNIQRIALDSFAIADAMIAQGTKK